MKKFSLAGLLRLRQGQQEEAGEVLATANGQVHSIQVRRRTLVDALSATSDSPVDPASLLAIAAARSSTQSMLTELAALETVAEAERDKAQTVFNGCRSRSLALEKMADRHQVTETFRELDAEQKVLDEIAVNSFQKRSPAQPHGA